MAEKVVEKKKKTCCLKEAGFVLFSQEKPVMRMANQKGLRTFMSPGRDHNWLFSVVHVTNRGGGVCVCVGGGGLTGAPS